MSETSHQMKNLVEFVAKSLVEDPTQVEIEILEETRLIMLRLKVADDDTGRVIGKDGRVAQAMRSILRTMAKDSGKRVNLKIL